MGITDNGYVELEQEADDRPIEEQLASAHNMVAVLEHAAVLRNTNYAALEQDFTLTNSRYIASQGEIARLKGILASNLTDQQRQYLALCEDNLRSQPGSEAYEALNEQVVRLIHERDDLITTSGEISQLLQQARNERDDAQHSAATWLNQEADTQIKLEKAQIALQTAQDYAASLKTANETNYEAASKLRQALVDEQTRRADIGRQLELATQRIQRDGENIAHSNTTIRDLRNNIDRLVTERNAYVQQSGRHNRTIGHLVGVLGEWAAAIPPVPTTNLTISEQQAAQRGGDGQDDGDDMEVPF